MPSIYQLKPAFQGLLRPVVKKLVHLGATANQVTLLACFLSCLVAGALIFYPHSGMFIILPFFMFVRMALNAIDGMMAREHHQQSKLGGILNEVTDVVSDTALYLVFYVYYQSHMILLFIFMAILSEFVGVLGPSIGSTRRYDGPMGKSDRAFVIGVISLVITCTINLASYIAPIFGILNILLGITIYNRATKAIAS